MEAVRALAAVGADHHAHRERRAILVRTQRAQIVGDALRQHRHDAIGEIHRVAAHARLAVERGAGPHEPGDIGNGDADDVPARIFRIAVRLGVHGVVMVLGVGRIDGDERDVAPILAAVADGGRAASASLSTAEGNTCGMPWALIAIRLTAFSLLSEPSRSTTRAVGKPKPRRGGAVSTATRSPSSASPVAPAGIMSSRPTSFLSIGESRPPPSGSLRKIPSVRCLARSMILMTRPV